MQGVPWHIEYLRKPESRMKKQQEPRCKTYSILELEKRFFQNSGMYRHAKELADAMREYDCIQKSCTYTEYNLARKRCSVALSDFNALREAALFDSILFEKSPIIAFSCIHETVKTSIFYEDLKAPVLYENTVPPSFFAFTEYAEAKQVPIMCKDDWRVRLRDVYDLAAIQTHYNLFKDIDSAIKTVFPSPEICKTAKYSIENNGRITVGILEKHLQSAIDSIIYEPKHPENPANKYTVYSCDCRKFLSMLRLRYDVKHPGKIPHDSTVVDLCFSPMRDVILRFSAIDR